MSRKESCLTKQHCTQGCMFCHEILVMSSNNNSRLWKCDNEKAEHYCHVFTFNHQACMLYEEKYLMPEEK